MAKVKKPSIKAQSRKFRTVPSTPVVSALKFRKKSDLKTFLKWIESSNRTLKKIKAPSRREITKLSEGSKSGGGFPWLLALLGIGGVAAGVGINNAIKNAEGEGDQRIDNIQKTLGQDQIRTITNFSGRMPTEIDLPKNKTFKIEKVKTGGPTKKTKIKSKSLKKVNKGTKPGKVKIDKGKITSSKNLGKAPSIPKKIEVKTEKLLKKNPLKKVKLTKGFKGFLRGTATKVGGVLAVADVAHTTVDRLQEGQSVDQAVTGAVAEGVGSWYGFGGGFKLGSAVTAKVASPLLLAPFPGARPLYGFSVLAGGVAGGFAGSHIGRKTFGHIADRITGAFNKMEAKSKNNDVKTLNENNSPQNVIVPFSSDSGNVIDNSQSSIPFGTSFSDENGIGIDYPIDNPLNNMYDELLINKLDGY
tara:strand:+ start:627 stop:1874 length:1248 start_codon:yes stop_codon:yes gene_type:complete